MSKNQLADIFDAVSKQLRNADTDTAMKWFNQGRSAAKDFAKNTSETVVDASKDAKDKTVDFLKHNDQVQAVKQGATVASRKAKENPLLTAAAVAAVAAAAYQLNKRASKKKENDGLFDGFRDE